MMIFFDGTFWSRHFCDVYVTHINRYCEILISRILSGFNSIAEEGDEIAERKLETIGKAVGPDADTGSLYEAALDYMIDSSIALYSVYQTILNSSLPILYHMYEQQLLDFYRRQLLPKYEEDNLKELSLHKVRQQLMTGGVDITTFASWTRMEELRLIANTVKHAEGKSAIELRKVRPDLFGQLVGDVKSGDNTSSSGRIPSSLRLPLSGRDLFVTIDDITTYQEAVVGFWHELGVAITRRN